jgi:hypothetical protein
MNTAIIVIAICEVIRTIQLAVDMVLGVRNRKTLNNAFIESLKQDNREWVKNTLKEFEKEYENEA